MLSNDIPKNAKYIGYKCIRCEKEIDEDERQNIISLGLVQTWCMICLAKKYPSDKHLNNYIQSNGNDDTIIFINKIINGQNK